MLSPAPIVTDYSGILSMVVLTGNEGTKAGFQEGGTAAWRMWDLVAYETAFQTVRASLLPDHDPCPRVTTMRRTSKTVRFS